MPYVYPDDAVTAKAAERCLPRMRTLDQRRVRFARGAAGFVEKENPRVVAPPARPLRLYG